MNNGFIDLGSVSFRLKQRREYLGFSLDYVSNELFTNLNIKLGVSAIWKYENNQIKQLNINTIAALSKIYMVSEKYILYGDASMEINTSGEISDKKLSIINFVLKINDIDVLRTVESYIKQEYHNSGIDHNNY